MACTVTKTVLIVDNNAFVRQALCELFARESDFAVCGDAENGKEAVEKAQKLHPDLIVLDLSMPVMNGLNAARVLKRLMPTVPLIMYSAFGDKSMEHQAQLIGISEVVSKSENAQCADSQSTRSPLRHRRLTLQFYCAACSRQHRFTSSGAS